MKTVMVRSESKYQFDTRLILPKHWLILEKFTARVSTSMKNKRQSLERANVD
jgi:hypothetical protein